MQEIGFGVFAKKAAPRTAAKEGQDFRARAELFQHLVIALPDAGGERPLHHFGVRSGREISAAERRVSRQIIAGRGHLQPVGVFLEGSKKIGEPAVLVTVVVGSGPDAELFHVIAHGGHAAGVDAGGIAQISDDVSDFAERNEIAQSFLPGVKPHGSAAVFGNVGAKEFFRFEARGEEMDVIDERVSDVGGGESGGKLRFPDALGKPGAGGKPAEMFLEINGEAGDLFKLIFGRNRNEDRFIEAATDEFHLAALDQPFQASEILRPVFLDPSEKRPGIMEAETNSRMLFKVLNEWKIGSVVGLFEDMLEIAAGLVRVNEQSEMEFLRHGGSFFSVTS